MQLNVPLALHRRLKMEAYRRGMTLREAFIAAVEEWLKEHEGKSGPVRELEPLLPNGSTSGEGC